MPSSEARLWFADEKREFRGQEPCFFNTDDFPWVHQIESNWLVIRDELLAQLERDDSQLVPYLNHEMMSQPKKWRTLGLMFWAVESKTNRALFPRTWALLEQVPNLTAVSFNLLEGHTTIKPHSGNTNAIIRCHLGLVVPDSIPRCGFRVGNETRSWDEGKFLMFCDAHQHTAWNNTDQNRYIMVLDVMRPEFVSQQKRTCSRVLASIYHESACQRIGWLRRLCNRKWAASLTTSVFRAYYMILLSFGSKSTRSIVDSGH